MKTNGFGLVCLLWLQDLLSMMSKTAKADRTIHHQKYRPSPTSKSFRETCRPSPTSKSFRETCRSSSTNIKFQGNLQTFFNQHKVSREPADLLQPI